MRTGNDILADFALPGRLLLFVDDSGTSGKPLPGLAADFQLLCGVAIRGESYEKVRDTWRSSWASRRSTEGGGHKPFRPNKGLHPTRFAPG
jgi:hypothetical protein